MATVNDIEPLLARAVRCGYNIKFLSEPAIGKTMEIHRCADKWMALPVNDPNYIDFFSVLNGPSVSPIDLSATMPDMMEGILRRFHDGSLPNHYKTPDARGFIFMGEGEQMGMEAQRPWQKISNHEDFGDHLHPIRLPAQVIICTDGNLMSDRSGGQQQGRALGSRFDTIRLRFDTDIALTYLMGRFHPKIAAFLKRNMGCINNYKEVFDPAREDNDAMKVEGKHGIWASMRTWDRLSRKLYDAERHKAPLMIEEYECVGAGMAGLFQEYLHIVDKLASLEQVVKDPLGADVPKQMDEQYAMTYMLALTAKAKIFAQISKYMHRMPREMQVALLLTVNERFNDLQKKAAPGTKVTEGLAIRETDAYMQWTAEPGIGDLMLSQLG